MHLANKLYITKIYHSFEGDVYFPTINEQEWTETSRIKGIVDDKNKYAHDFIVYEKIKSNF